MALSSGLKRPGSEANVSPSTAPSEELNPCIFLACTGKTERLLLLLYINKHMCVCVCVCVCVYIYIYIYIYIYTRVRTRFVNRECLEYIIAGSRRMRR